MSNNVRTRRMAILATDGFEESELFLPKAAIESAGGAVDVVSLKLGSIQGYRHMDKGRDIGVDLTLGEADPKDYDAILIPGGLFNPDALRTERDALKFAGAFVTHRKPVFAICHGPQVLISAGLANGRKMTAVKAIQKDLENAGANVVDEPVVNDAGLVTSRTPDDLAAFNAEIVREFLSDDSDRHPKHYTWALF